MGHPPNSTSTGYYRIRIENLAKIRRPVLPPLPSVAVSAHTFPLPIPKS